MTLWKCPDPDCPPTGREPLRTSEPGGIGPSQLLCRSECGETYRQDAFTRSAEGVIPEDDP